IWPTWPSSRTKACETPSAAGERREHVDGVTGVEHRGSVGRGHGVDEEARPREHGRRLRIGILGEGGDEFVDGSGADVRLAGAEGLAGGGEEPEDRKSTRL